MPCLRFYLRQKWKWHNVTTGWTWLLFQQRLHSTYCSIVIPKPFASLLRFLALGRGNFSLIVLFFPSHAIQPFGRHLPLEKYLSWSALKGWLACRSRRSLEGTSKRSISHVWFPLHSFVRLLNIPPPRHCLDLVSLGKEDQANHQWPLCSSTITL